MTKKNTHSKPARVNTKSAPTINLDEGDLVLTQEYSDIFQSAANVLWDAHAVLELLASASREKCWRIGPGSANQRPVWTAVQAIAERCKEIACGLMDTNKWDSSVSASDRLFGMIHELSVYATAFDNEMVGDIDAVRPIEIAQEISERAHRIASGPVLAYREHEHLRRMRGQQAQAGA